MAISVWELKSRSIFHGKKACSVSIDFPLCSLASEGAEAAMIGRIVFWCRRAIKQRAFARKRVLRVSTLYDDILWERGAI